MGGGWAGAAWPGGGWFDAGGTTGAVRGGAAAAAGGCAGGCGGGGASVGTAVGPPGAVTLTTSVVGVGPPLTVTLTLPGASPRGREEAIRKAMKPTRITTEVTKATRTGGLTRLTRRIREAPPHVLSAVYASGVPGD